MKKITILAVAALMAVSTAVAQTKGQIPAPKKVDRTALTKAPERPVHKLSDVSNRQMNRAARNDMPQQQSLQTLAAKKQLPARRSAKKASRRAASIITEQPAGTYYNMVYACDYYGYSMFGFYNGSHSAAFAEVVEGDDGCLYIHNLLTEMYTEEGYWVKAEKVEGKDATYVIHEQPIYVENYYGTLYTYSIMKVVFDESAQTMVPAEDTDIYLTWKKGELRTADELNRGMEVSIGAIDDSGYWSGALNWNITMTVQEDKVITELPAGVESAEMVMKYADQPAQEATEEAEAVVPTLGAKKVQMAVSGSDIYLQLSEELGWIKGTIAGNKATFATGQYLGASTEYSQHEYFMASSDFATLADQVVFDYDATTHKLSGSNMYVFENGGKSTIYYINLYYNPEIFKFVEVAATPLPVDDSTFSGYNYDRSYGMGWIDFEAPFFDAEGNYLDTDKLYYKVYIGTDESNKVFEFTPEEYAGLTETTTEVPYAYADGDFWCNGTSHEFTIYVNKAKNFGVQMIYKGGGETNASAISWFGENNGAEAWESTFPYAADPTIMTELPQGEMIAKLGEISYAFGTGRADTETYDVGMKLQDIQNSGALLAGMKVKGVTVPIMSTDGLSNTKVWLSKNINLSDDGIFTPDVCSKAFTVSEPGLVTVYFDEPYEITEDGVTIGYSFTQAYDAMAESTPEPVVLTGETNIAGFLIHTDKVYRLGWATMTNYEGDLALEVILDGAKADAAEFDYIDDAYLMPDQDGKTTATICNFGYNGLKSLEYNYKLLGDGVEKEGTYTVENLNLPAVFGGYTKATIDVAAASVLTDLINYVDITKANGQENGITEKEAQNNVFMISFLPKKRPLLEEYTGTWCGYCPRGYVALEKMAELYPEDFVALSYHNEDPMEVFTTYDYPNEVSGFPAAYLDREWEVDAYYGIYDEDFGIEQTWKERGQLFATADVDVTAAWSEDGNTINVSSKVKFPRAEDYASYTIGYAVVADGLTGTDSGWEQSNYYAGESPMLYMDQFTSGESYVYGLVFNDVIVASTGVWGIDGSLPETIEASKEYTHEYSFDASQIVNTSGNPVIQDKSKVKVVAMLLSWGSVVNANKCTVTGAADGIIEVGAQSADVQKTEYFDLSGRKMSVPANGVFIQSQKLKNGETVTRKVILK